jgi:hypothetical protein
MKRYGPPFGSGPSAEKRMRVAGQHSHTRSDSGPASFSSPSPARSTASKVAVAPTMLTITLKPTGVEDRFDAILRGLRIVTASRQPVCDAARVLHRSGYSDQILLVARHVGADHDAIQGPLGVWRKLRVRQDRGGDRFAPWDPFPERRVRGGDANAPVKGIEVATDANTQRRAQPGAAGSNCPTANSLD